MTGGNFEVIEEGLIRGAVEVEETVGILKSGPYAFSVVLLIGHHGYYC
jgi:hypothetical protein